MSNTAKYLIHPRQLLPTLETSVGTAMQITAFTGITQLLA